MNPGSIIRCDCSDCERETQHTIIHNHKHMEKEWVSDVTELEFEHQYCILQCGGCGTFSFLHRQYSDEGKAFDEQYPDPFDGVDDDIFLTEEEREVLPKRIADLYTEVQNAYQDESNILAGIGLRTLVEAICVHQKISGRVLKDKIENLHTKGLISASELPILLKLREIGNVSAHQIKAIPFSKLEHAVHVINHLINSVYVLPWLNKRL